MRIWEQAVEVAAKTPPQRNRYVDFLRAISILIVICGHWLIATAYYVDGTLALEHMFKIQPPTQWLTWIFQVMPLFFIVGGYANAVSLESAQRKGIGYAGWLSSRLHRLFTPLLALIAAWTAFAALMYLLGVDAAVIQLISRSALVPTWFLAIYIMVVVLAPLMYRFWRAYGFASFWILAVVAGCIDLVFFLAGLRWPGWSNYFWVWLAIHSLGFAWRDNRPGKHWQQLACAALAFGGLWSLVYFGPYSPAMVGFPEQALSNTTPPKITLLALGLFQFGLLLALERPVRRALLDLRLWSATVLVNSMIMTIYLWHITLMIALLALLYFTGGAGLTLLPGSLGWWLARPLWLAALAILLLPLALLLSPLERRSRRPGAGVAPASRQVVGAALICLGIALLALHGFGGGPLPGLDFGSVALVLAGAGIGGLLPGRRRRQQPRGG